MPDKDLNRRRFYVSRESIRDGVAYLASSQTHHLKNVLRLGPGEIVEVFDGEGQGYAGRVEVQGSQIAITDLQPLSSEQAPVRITLAPALIKSDRFEWILQKATELGVHEIVPLVTRLSDIRIPEGRLNLRLQRWSRIVLEAARQSRRSVAPALRSPVDFDGFLSSEKFSACTRLLFYEKAAILWPAAETPIEGEMLLCTGPEGGWENREVEQAQASGFQVFSLGPWVLRAETAAIAAVSILQHHIFSKVHRTEQVS